MQDKINILFLDDDENRGEMFCKIVGRLVRVNVIWVKTAKEAKDALMERHWNLITLDHDLGGKVFVPSGDNTGYEVAKAISEIPAYDNQTVFIHSWNPDGAKNMGAVLKKSLHVPFSKDYSEMVVDFVCEMM